MTSNNLRDWARALVAGNRDIGLKGENWKNEAIASAVLHAELGYLGNGIKHKYNLNEDTEDTLLAHARQDAAHALLNSISLLKISRILLIICAANLSITVAAIALSIWG